MELATIMMKTLPSINTEMMSNEEIHKKLQRGYADAQAGNVKSAAVVFAEFRKKH